MDGSAARCGSGDGKGRVVGDRQVMREQIRVLRDCGRDGRLQSGLLEAALQQQ